MEKLRFYILLPFVIGGFVVALAVWFTLSLALVASSRFDRWREGGQK